MTLKSMRFPHCVPIDYMHLFHLNLAEHVYKILASQVQNTNVWEDAGRDLVRNRKQIPSNWRQKPLRNINNHYNGFKASEWRAWLNNYALPSLDGRITATQLDILSRLVYASCLVGEHKLDMVQIDILREMLSTFLILFEK